MGDRNRIPKLKDRKFSDVQVERLFKIDPSHLSHKLSPFFTRPVYQYTSAEVGGINYELPNV